MKQGVAALAAACAAAFMLASPAKAAQTGSCVAWGQQVMPLVQPGTRFKKIAAGFAHSLALKSDGTVVAWGDNAYGLSTVPANLSGASAIAAGSYHNLALVRAAVSFGVSRRLPDGNFQMEVFGQLGWSYRLQGSTNLADWIPVRNFTCTNSPTLLLDAGSAPAHFYRIVQSP